MNLYRFTLPITLISIILLLAFYGCPGGPKAKKITITASECPSEQITVEDQSKVTTTAGSQWRLSAKIVVKCNGEVVKDAEIKVEFWWPSGTYKLTTNAQGEATYTKRGQGSPPYGEEFTVTLIGSDKNEINKKFEIKRNN